MIWKKKQNRPDLSSRSPKKRKNFFEKKEELPQDPVVARAIFRILIIFFVASVAYILFFSPFLEIKDIQLKGTSEIKYEEVYQEIKMVLSGKYLRFIPKDNLIIFPKQEMGKSLLDKFKKINSIETKKHFPSGIEIEITERKTLFVWCSSGSCYIVDENGYAYMEADFNSEQIKQNHLVTLIDDSSKQVSIGDKVLQEEYINFVANLRDELRKETGLEVTDEFHTQSRIAEEAKVMTSEGWQIFFSSVIPIESSLQTLKTFLEKQINEESKSKLEYVDLRAENKVYYKFKDEEPKDGEETKDDPENQEQSKQEDKKDDNKKKD